MNVERQSYKGDHTNKDTDCPSPEKDLAAVILDVV